MARLIPPEVTPGTLALHEQPVLHGGGLVLRPWTIDDREVVAEAYRDPDIQRWHLQRFDEHEEPDGPEAWIAATRAGWQAETTAGWAVAFGHGARPVARVSIHLDLPAGRGEITYWVLPSGRGHGVAAYATRAVAAWAFDDAGLHRLLVQHSVHNPASCAVAKRAGFPATGTDREGLRHIDGWHDMHQHVRLRTDPAGVG